MYKDPATFITEQTDQMVNTSTTYQKIVSQIVTAHSEFISNSIRLNSDLAKTVLKTFTK